MTYSDVLNSFRIWFKALNTNFVYDLDMVANIFIYNYNEESKNLECIFCALSTPSHSYIVSSPSFALNKPLIPTLYHIRFLHGSYIVLM